MAQEALEIKHGPFTIRLVDIELIDQAQKNARYMRHEMFKRFVSNIQNDGGLSSVPFCVLENGRYTAVSGNHRVLAAKESGLNEIPVMFVEGPLDRDKFIAMQLSHNAIVGEDDPVILLDLYREIETVWAKEYTGLDSKLLADLEKIELQGLSDAKPIYYEMTFLFLPSERERLIEALDRIGKMAGEFIIATEDVYKPFLEAQRKIKKSYNAYNGAVALIAMLDIIDNHLEDLRDGYLNTDGSIKHKGKVPLASVFGTDEVPSEAAAQLVTAIDAISGKEGWSKGEKWKALLRIIPNEDSIKA